MTRQGQWNCKRIILLPPEKPQWRRKALSRKQSNFSSSAILLYKSQPFKPQSFRPQLWLRAQSLTALPSPHLRYLRTPTAASFLRHVLNQTSQQKSLYGQYWRNAFEASRAAGIRCKGLENQSRRAEKRSRRIRQHWWGATPSEIPFVPEIIWTELLDRKYYWPSLRKGIEAYVRDCNVCLTSKTVKHKPYSNLQALPVSSHRWKDLLIDFVTGLPVSTNWKGESYNSILVIIARLTKMVYYKPVKVTINAPGLAEVILDVVVWHHGLPDSIVSDRGSLFTSKFWSSLCYFLGRTAPWRPTFGPSSTSSRTIGPGSYRWLSSRITTPRMRALATRLSSWTVDTTLGCLTKKTSTPALSPSQQMSYQQN